MLSLFFSFYISIYPSMSKYFHVCISTHTHTHTHVQVYMYIYTCISVKTYIYIEIYNYPYFPVAAESPSCFLRSRSQTPILFLTEGASVSASPGAFQKLVKMVGENRYGNYLSSHCCVSIYRSINYLYTY